MPGPTTEVLSDDLKEMRSDLRRVETTLTVEIHRVETTLTVEIHRVNSTVAKLAAEFGLLKWLVGASLVASVSGVITSAYWAGSLASRVTNLEVRVVKLDTRLDRIDGHLDRIEASIAKVASRSEGAGSITPEKR